MTKIKICPECHENVIRYGTRCSSCEMLDCFFFDGVDDWRMIQDDTLYNEKLAEFKQKLQYHDYWRIWFNYWTKPIGCTALNNSITK